jgi:hypothetical protein
MKRFLDTDWYNQDWLISLDPINRDFWFYMLSTCDCSGVWTPSTRRYELLSGEIRIDLNYFLKKVNSDKKRIVKLKNGNYFIKNFIPFQYCKNALRLDTVRNTAHLGVFRCLIQNEVDINLIEPKIEIITQISERTLEEPSKNPQRTLEGNSKGHKDKDKDKDSDKDKNTDKEKDYEEQFEDFLNEEEKTEKT